MSTRSTRSSTKKRSEASKQSNPSASMSVHFEENLEEEMKADDQTVQIGGNNEEETQEEGIVNETEDAVQLPTAVRGNQGLTDVSQVQTAVPQVPVPPVQPVPINLSLANPLPVVPAPVPTVAPAPAVAAVGQVFNINVDSMADIADMFDIARDASQYNGLDLNEIRKTFLNKYPGNNTTASRDLALLLLGYIRVGNKIGKLNSKRKDTAITKEMVSLSQRIGVVAKANTATDLTYPRIALAFMGELLICRKFLANDLQKQIDCQLDVEYHDLVFAGCPQLSSMAGYADFHKGFSALIYRIKTKAGKVSYGVESDDATFVANHERWLKVAKNGYSRDTKLHASIRAAIAFNPANNANKRMAVWQYIKDSLAAYRVAYNI
jgi:hypothetical protein